MEGIIRRLLRLLKRLGIIKKIYRVTYKGKGVSLNQYYSQQHWTQRHALVKKYIPILTELIEEKLPEREFLKHYGLIIFYNSRHDPDNVVGIEKIFMDALKGKYVTEDDKRFYKLFMVVPATELEFNTFEFNLVKIA